MRFLKKFKSPWYYWHTGHKKIALLSMLLSAGILWICLGATVGFSMIGIILAILLDGIGLGLALLYLIFLEPIFLNGPVYKVMQMLSSSISSFGRCLQAFL